MQRDKTDATLKPNAFLPEPGKAREEFYEPTHKSAFGLNKRTRWKIKGIPVTTPSGEWIK